MPRLPLHRRSFWSESQVRDFLENCLVPLRLSVNSSTGYPVLCTLWFLLRDQRLWCATSRKAKICSLLRQDNRCAFEVSPDLPPYRGVRGRGMAYLQPASGQDVLSDLVDRYLEDRNSHLANWLLSRADDEVAIAIEPQWIYSWDFTRRMTRWPDQSETNLDDDRDLNL